jgi:hypothetical protein
VSEGEKTRGTHRFGFTDLSDVTGKSALDGIGPKEDGMEEIIAALECVPHLLLQNHFEVRRVYVRLVNLDCHWCCVFVVEVQK